MLPFCAQNATMLSVEGHEQRPSVRSEANLSAVGGRDIFLVKLDASSDYKWAIRGGSTLNDFG